MRRFILIVDEHGNLSADKDAHPYGYGFLLAEQGPVFAGVEAKVRSAFPSGFHLKEYRRTRKLAKARKMLDLLPTVGHFYGGGHVQTDPAYGRNKFYDEISGRANRSDSPSSALIAAIHEAPLDPHGLLLPTEVMPAVLGDTRLIVTYSHVLRIPMIALLKAIPHPEDVVLDVQLGVVGREETYVTRMAGLIEHLYVALQKSWELSIEKGEIMRGPKEINIEPITSDAVLLGVADLFAGIACHYYRYTLDGNYGLGKELYAAAMPILKRMPWQPPEQAVIAKGITKM